MSCESRFPEVLNLGSGKTFLKSALNVDINISWSPDIVFDFNVEFPNGALYITDRFGEIRIAHDYFSRIVAFDVLEHLRELRQAMDNCLNLLRVGGELHVKVPYDLSHGAWQDPTHVRAFNEKSWRYYTDWHWYLGWVKARFDLEKLDFELSDFGNEMLRKGASHAELLVTPRAIDGMDVVLRKVKLTQKEISNAHKMMSRG